MQEMLINTYIKKVTLYF